MPTESELRVAVGEIQRYAERLGYQTEYLGRREDGETDATFEDIRVDAGSGEMFVTGSPDSLHFLISYSYDYVTHVSNSIREAKIQREVSHLNEPNYHVAKEMIRQTRYTGLLIDGLRLFAPLSGQTEVLEVPGDTGFSGFTLTTHLFPYEADFGIRQFDCEIRRMVTAGTRGSSYLRLATLIREPSETQSGLYELSIRPGLNTDRK